MFGILCGLTLCLPGSPPANAEAQEVDATEPTVTFELSDGFVTFQVRKDGKPLVDVRTKVLVGSQVLADGETDKNGEGFFPRPTQLHCQVVFDIGKGPTAPIPLSFHPDGTMTPTHSTVSESTPECCRIPTRQVAVAAPTPAPTPTESPSPSLRDRYIIAGLVLLFNGTILGVVLLRGRCCRATPSASTL